MQENRIIKLGDLENEEGHRKFECCNKVYSSEGISPTMMAAQGYGGGCETKILDKVKVVGKLKEGFDQVYQVVSPDGISPTLDCCTGGNRQVKIYNDYEYRIRKLTPRECGRLMGVDDEDISKMEQVQSNAQLYKQFGNSIVVDVLCAIFKNLNIEQEKV